MQSENIFICINCSSEHYSEESANNCCNNNYYCNVCCLNFQALEDFLNCGHNFRCDRCHITNNENHCDCCDDGWSYISENHNERFWCQMCGQCWQEREEMLFCGHNESNERYIFRCNRGHVSSSEWSNENYCIICDEQQPDEIIPFEQQFLFAYCNHNTLWNLGSAEQFQNTNNFTDEIIDNLDDCKICCN